MKISSSAIQAELERVLDSRCFRSRKAAQKFLIYVVQRTVEGHGKAINQHSIAIEALGKAPDFDPSSNPLIRVQAGRLRKQLEEYYAGEGRENLVRIVLPVGSYQPAFMHRDEHQKRNVYAGRPKSPGTSQGPGLICVPRMFTHDKTAGWEIITRLTRDYVISLTQFNFCQILFADENKSQKQVWPDAAWTEYETDFALLFDLYDDDNGYNLKCSLAHSRTRQVVWAENYILGKDYPDESSLQTIFKRIAHDTVGLEQGVAHDFWARHLLDMKSPILPQYQVMLALRQRIWELNPTTLNEAREICADRMDTFPRDVQNLIVYADLCRTEFLVKYNEFDALCENWKDLAGRLMHLAPGNAYSHLFYAFVNLVNDQLDACEESLQQALKISPLDTHLNAMAGLIYMGKGDWDEGAGLITNSMKISPVYPDWYNIPLALNLYRNGSYAEAMKAANKVRTSTFWGPLLRTVLYRRNDLDEQAQQELDKLIETHPGFTEQKPAYLNHFTPPANDLINQLWSELAEK
ncbi:MAG: hypothetical protein ACPGSM_06115 [Thiolinea sp.]